jgi:hypothetical protein
MASDLSLPFRVPTLPTDVDQRREDLAKALDLIHRAHALISAAAATYPCGDYHGSNVHNAAEWLTSAARQLAPLASIES